MSIQKLRGLGPKSQAMLQSIGIKTDQAFLAADVFELYSQLKQQGVPVSLNLLYAMIGAQENKHWQEIKRDQKMDILIRLDDLGIAPK
jgi:DNA transformation protein